MQKHPAHLVHIKADCKQATEATRLSTPHLAPLKTVMNSQQTLNAYAPSQQRRPLGAVDTSRLHPPAPNLSKGHEQSPTRGYGGYASLGGSPYPGAGQGYMGLSVPDPSHLMGEELRRLGLAVEEQASSINQLDQSQQQQSQVLQALTDTVARLEKEMEEEKARAVAAKGGSARAHANGHPDVKKHVHQMYVRLCDINVEGRYAISDALGAIQPLSNGEAFETAPGPGTDTKKVWKPDWRAGLRNPVNALFIKEVAECVYQDEQDRRGQDKSKAAKIPNESFDRDIITTVVKTYFGNFTRRAQQDDDDARAARARDANRDNRRFQRAKTLARTRRAAAEPYESVYPGIVGTIHTDFCTDQETCSEGDMTDHMLQASQLRQGAYPSCQYTTLMRWLSLVSAAGNNEGGERPQKRRKTTGRGNRNAWDAAPNTMRMQPPSTGKGVPFYDMVDTNWLARQVERPKMVDARLKWLQSFHTDKKDELKEKDRLFIEEAEEWKKENWELCDGEVSGEVMVASTLPNVE
ncbi:hypothetical protein CONPUDRAFT_69158 [Coniophora puteana RWD-64-598 SS2]|uniref:Uncharacterized protein n=1 Tax=Coniophora puteana (strain RWD-64-598) TaxID=741705 RepID=A0A5M3N5Z6_CONPW|nr:uncharacterized protein CONPUDRAFT_69158 [Coniophora puteana RWD-64-598 SS2]EIW86728.1 hypothetical protein CONPUDRAFT_69158 [Coniophora puteana RWD-64-598 SS2]